MASSPSEEVRFVSAETLRHLFNESQLPSMIASGMLVAQFLRDDHLKEPGSVGEPFCTRAQMVRYLDADGQWRVEVFSVPAVRRHSRGERQA